MMYVIDCGLELLEKAKEPNSRCNLAFKQVEIYVEINAYKDAFNRCMDEYKQFSLHMPEGVKRTTFAMDLIILALLMRDVILAENLLNKCGNE